MSTSVMTDRVMQAWPRLYARIAGALYFIVIVGGIFAEIFVRGRLLVHGDAAATAHNIEAHEPLYAGPPSPIKSVRTPKIAMIPTRSTHNTQSAEIVEMTVLVIYPSLTPPDWLRSVASRAQLPT